MTKDNMKYTRRNIGLAAAALVLAACAGPAPKEAALSPDQVAATKLATYTLDISAIGEETGGRKIPVAQVEAELRGAIEDNVVPRGTGRPGVVAIVVESVNILTAGQALLVGGESVARGTVSLVDEASGSVIVPPIEISSGGGGWTAGGIFGAAAMEDREIELQQISLGFAVNARRALIGN